MGTIKSKMGTLKSKMGTNIEHKRKVNRQEKKQILSRPTLDEAKELELQDRCCAESLELDSWIVQMKKFKVQSHVHAHACGNNAKSGCGT